METIVRKQIGHLFKYMAVQQLGGGRGNVVYFNSFFSSVCCHFQYYLGYYFYFKDRCLADILSIENS